MERLAEIEERISKAQWIDDEHIDLPGELLDEYDELLSLYL